MDITYEKSIFASTDPQGIPYIRETPYIEPFLRFDGLEERLGNDEQGFYERKQYGHDTKFPIIATQPLKIPDYPVPNLLDFKPRDLYFRDPDYEIEPVGNMEWISNTELNNLLFNVFSDGTPKYAAKAGPNPEQQRQEYALQLQRLDEILANPDPTIANAIGASSQRDNLLNKIKLSDPTFYMTIQSGENEKRMMDLKNTMLNVNSNILASQIQMDDVNAFIVDVNSFVRKYTDEKDIPEDVLYKFEKVDLQLEKFLNDPNITASQKQRLRELGNGLRSVLGSSLFTERANQEEEYLQRMKEQRTAELEQAARMKKVEDIVQMHEDLLSGAALSGSPDYEKMRKEHIKELKEYQKVAETNVEKEVVKEMLSELLGKPRKPPVEEKETEKPMTTPVTTKPKKPEKEEEKSPTFFFVSPEDYKRFSKSKENPLKPEDTEILASIDNEADLRDFLSNKISKNVRSDLLEILRNNKTISLPMRDVVRDILNEQMFGDITDDKLRGDIQTQFGKVLGTTAFTTINKDNIESRITGKGRTGRIELLTLMRGAFNHEDMNKLINKISDSKIKGTFYDKVKEFIKNVDNNTFVSDNLFEDRFTSGTKKITKLELIQMFDDAFNQIEATKKK